MWAKIYRKGFGNCLKICSEKYFLLHDWFNAALMTQKPAIFVMNKWNRQKSVNIINVVYNHNKSDKKYKNNWIARKNDSKNVGIWSTNSTCLKPTMEVSIIIKFSYEYERETFMINWQRK